MNKDKIKSELLSNFDFEKAHYIMKFLDWKWGLLPDGYHVPTVEQIRDTVSRLIDDLLNDDRIKSVSSGGFTVYKSSEATDNDYDTIRVGFEAIGSRCYLEE